MKTIRIYRLTGLSPTLFRRLKAARLARARWPDVRDLQHATRGQFALNA